MRACVYTNVHVCIGACARACTCNVHFSRLKHQDTFPTALNMLTYRQSFVRLFAPFQFCILATNVKDRILDKRRVSSIKLLIKYV